MTGRTPEETYLDLQKLARAQGRNTQQPRPVLRRPDHTTPDRLPHPPGRPRLPAPGISAGERHRREGRHDDAPRRRQHTRPRLRRRLPPLRDPSRRGRPTAPSAALGRRAPPPRDTAAGATTRHAARDPTTALGNIPRPCGPSRIARALLHLALGGSGCGRPRPRPTRHPYPAPAPMPAARSTNPTRACHPGSALGGFEHAPERIRTSDLRFRRPTLYPAELRAQGRGVYRGYPGPR